MTDLAPPAWVTKRDGRLEPFDADRISRALFAASESLGQPDAFLARELADSVVHFLAEDCDGQTPTTQRIAEVVAQVVGALGHPALANAFARHRKTPAATSPRRTLAEVLAAAARNYTLQTVYTRDLTAAQEAGLITLTGLATPGELAGCVLGAPLALTGDVVADLEQARRFAGQLVALEGLEHQTHQSPGDLADAVVRGLRLTGLAGVVNLNIATPPSWASDLATGPLFTSASAKPIQLRERAEELLRQFLRLDCPTIRIDWHLTKTDFSDREKLLNVLRHALTGSAIGFVLDRPPVPIALAEGLDRRHPATLLLAGVHLPALLGQPGMLADPGRFVQRLGSLVRLALSAAVQKRAYLRQQRPRSAADVTSGFLLDRARFVVVPIGVDDVVRQYTGWSMCSGGPSLELGRQIIRRLNDVLRGDGRSSQLEACLDGPFSLELEGGAGVAGVTPWDTAAALRSQLRSGAALHAISAAGTLALHVGEATAEQIAECLEQAWSHTEVVRIRLVRPEAEQGRLFPT